MKSFISKTIFILLAINLLPLHMLAQTNPIEVKTVTLENSLIRFWNNTGFANLEWSYFLMIIIGIVFIYLGIKKKWEPLLLVPIGFGILIGNIPFMEGYQIGIYENGSVMNTLYSGVIKGWYPPLIFLGIGAMTDYSALIYNPKLILLGAAAQLGIFLTFIGAYL